MKRRRSERLSVPTIWLPFPNASEVEAFKALYKRLFGVTLTPEQALRTATCLLHIHYVLYSATRREQSDEQPN